MSRADSQIQGASLA